MFSTKIEEVEATDGQNTFLQRIFEYLLRKRRKTHNYTDQQCGIDYFFEVIACGERAHMTGQGKGLQTDDYLLLQMQDRPVLYQILSIDYYTCPSDTWIALLKRVP